MNKGINLLKIKQTKTNTQILRKLIILRLIAVGLLFSVGASSIILFILISLSPLPQLREQERISKFNLSRFHEDIAKLLIVNERLNSITEVITKRPSFVKKIDLIQSKMPADLFIKSFSIEKQLITITFSTHSLLSFDTFLNNVIEISGKGKTFSRILLTSLSREETSNSYLINMTLTTYE